MIDNCYVQDQGISISDIVIVEKDENYKKNLHPLKAAYCPECGYTEFYIALPETKVEKEKDDFMSRINLDSIMRPVEK